MALTSDDFKADLANISEQMLVSIDKSTGRGAGKFYQNLKSIQNPTQYQIDEFYKVIEHPAMKYPYGEALEKIDKLEGLLKSSNDLGVSFGDVFNGNTVKAIKYDLKNNGAVREKLVDKYEELMTTYNEIKGHIDDAYPEEVIPFANPHIGAGVITGGANATEQDENGNITFDPEKFVVGFLAGAGASKGGIETLKRVNPIKYNSLMGTAEKFSNLATHNPKLLAELYKKAPYKQNVAGMFAGEKAIKADIKKLDSAMKLKESGKSEADIWKETGWFKGDDGKWRFEIDDSEAKFLIKQDELRTMDVDYDGEGKRLSDVFKHDKLYEAYPNIKNIPVYVSNSVVANAKFEPAVGLDAMTKQPKVGFITLSYQGANKSTLLHEIQHGIQSIENMARGGAIDDFYDNRAMNPKYSQKLYDSYAKEMQRLLDSGVQYGDKRIKDLLEEWGNIPQKEFKPVDAYLRLHGEAEARLTQTRADLGAKYNSKNFPYKNLDVPRDELISRFDDGVAEMSKDFKKQFVDNENMLRKGIFEGLGVKNIKRDITIDEFKEQFNESVNNGFIKAKIDIDGLITKYKLKGKERLKDFGWVRATLDEPDIITEYLHNDHLKHTYNHIKIFNDIDGKDKLFMSVIGDDTGKDIIVTLKRLDNTTFKNIAESGKEVYISDKLAGKGIKIGTDDRTVYSVSPDAIPTQEQVNTRINDNIAKNYKDSQGFYSVLEKTIDEKVGGKIDTASLRKMLKNNGVKDDELEWSGLKELMENGEKLTKEQIEDVIKSNRLEIEVVERNNNLTEKIKAKYPNIYVGSEKWNEYTKELNKASSLQPSYEKYTILGGENYRELLFKLPDTKKGYTSGHWKEKNIVAFARIDDREIEGQKTLFIEEIQSDLHQTGKRTGYKADNKEAEARFNYLQRKMDSFNNDTELFKWYRSIEGIEYTELDKIVYKSGIRDTPFKKNWHEFTLKRLIQEAVADDYDKIAWTTGKQQNERYKITAKMETFYDEIVPNSAKKLFKKYGVKPKMEELDNIEEMVWSVDITPQMKEDIKKYGQPLYAVAGAGIIANETIGDEK